VDYVISKEDLVKMQEIINDCGTCGAFKTFIMALQQSADNMSDLGIKEVAVGRANMAELLQKVYDTLEE